MKLSAQVDHLADVVRTIETGTVEFSFCSAYKTRQLARKVMAHFEQSIKPLGLKGTQFSLLGFVQRDGPVTQTELATLMGLSTSTLSRNMQPLLANGWLELHSMVDGRSRTVSLTADGLRQFLRAAKRWQAAQVSLGQQLGVSELAMLHIAVDSALASFSLKGSR
jgi:DNA-binding MarR family transcriptional regulator